VHYFNPAQKKLMTALKIDNLLSNLMCVRVSA